MSEFTDVHYLKAETAEAGRSLLRQIGREGYVFEPQNGWVAIVPIGAMPMVLQDDVVEATASTAPLLWFFLAEDFAWGFAVAKNGAVAFDYHFALDGDDEEPPAALSWVDLDKHLAPFGARLDDAQKKEIFGEPGGQPDFPDCARAFARALWLPHSSWTSEHHLGPDLDNPNTSPEDIAAITVVKNETV